MARFPTMRVMRESSGRSYCASLHHVGLELVPVALEATSELHLIEKTVKMEVGN